MSERPHKRATWKTWLEAAVGLVIVLGIFLYAVPKFADYGDVWKWMKTLTPLEFWSLFAAMLFNLYTYWLANQAALPGLGMTDAPYDPLARAVRDRRPHPAPWRISMLAGERVRVGLLEQIAHLREGLATHGRPAGEPRLVRGTTYPGSVGHGIPLRDPVSYSHR